MGSNISLDNENLGLYIELGVVVLSHVRGWCGASGAIKGNSVRSGSCPATVDGYKPDVTV